ncbi:hypothetical protein MTR67_043350, partial [Solanum verrucosum]
LVRDVHRLALLDVKFKQNFDPIFVELKEVVLKKSNAAFSQGGYGVLRYKGRLCVPNLDGLKEQILEEAHSSHYTIHLGPTKIVTLRKIVG